MDEELRLGHFTKEKLDLLLKKDFKEPGERVVFLSQMFIGTPYRGGTLPGGNGENEILIVNFEAVDCMTFIEYVEALRLSRSFEEFKEFLRKVRYKEGVVSYSKRKHFFTDWIIWNCGLREVTTTLKKKTVRVKKRLNLRDDGSYIISGVEPVEREIVYLPSEEIDESAMDNLYGGDYIGFYTSLLGLDCSHVGILVRKEGDFWIRHASSARGKVLDEKFMEYVSKMEGIIVLRPKET